MSANIEQLSRELHDSFSNNQFDKTLSLVDDNVIIVSHATGMTFKGKDEFNGFMQGFKSAFTDMKIVYTNFVSNENKAAVEFTATGTHTGPLQTPNGPIPPSGKKVTLNVAEFLVWENGKLKSIHNYQDSGSLLRQIGVLK